MCVCIRVSVCVRAYVCVSARARVCVCACARTRSRTSVSMCTHARAREALNTHTRGTANPHLLSDTRSVPPNLLTFKPDLDLDPVRAGGQQARPGGGAWDAAPGGGQPGEEAVEMRLHGVLGQVQLAHHAALQGAHEEH